MSNSFSRENVLPGESRSIADIVRKLQLEISKEAELSRWSIFCPLEGE